MNVEALAIRIGRRRAGILFRYPLSHDHVVTCFVPDPEFAQDPQQPTLSHSLLADTHAEQMAFWADETSIPLNGTYSARHGWLLPSFFQNLLPEGAFRNHLAELRKCEPSNHFELLAAAGRDLPGNVYAEPVSLDRDELERLVTQHNDALEMSVTAEPMAGGVSVSGVQPKLAVVKQDGRYVARTKLQDTHIIAKLPVVDSPNLPELEELSLRLARAAGVNTVEAWLEPLSALEAEHNYDLGDADKQTKFMAVQRYDRDAPIKGPQDTGRVHAEDFAQVLGVAPENKYSGSYLEVAAVMATEQSLGEPAVHELLRRIFVNELLGNPDMHLKNIGLWYPDGRTPELPPAYDLVAYSAYGKGKTRGLFMFPEGRKHPLMAKFEFSEQGQLLTPNARVSMTPGELREFCSRLGLVEKPASTVLRRCADEAFKTWPALIESSGITRLMKERMLAHFYSHPSIESLARRAERRTERSAGPTQA